MLLLLRLFSSATKFLINMNNWTRCFWLRLAEGRAHSHLYCFNFMPNCTLKRQSHIFSARQDERHKPFFMRRHLWKDAYNGTIVIRRNKYVLRFFSSIGTLSHKFWFNGPMHRQWVVVYCRSIATIIVYFFTWWIKIDFMANWEALPTGITIFELQMTAMDGSTKTRIYRMHHSFPIETFYYTIIYCSIKKSIAPFLLVIALKIINFDYDSRRGRMDAISISCNIDRKLIDLFAGKCYDNLWFEDEQTTAAATTKATCS